MNFDIAFLHTGAMGIYLAASAKNSGRNVYWVSEGRSAATRARAEKYGLQDAGTIAAACETCSIIISVCPPHAAEDVAQEVISNSYKGLYVDVNAIAPARSIRIGRIMEQAGATYVDGGVIGGPAWKSGETWLYLSGGDAGRVATSFSKGPLRTGVIGDEIGRASALKMCYAAYTKGSTALLTAILAASESLGVRGELEKQWDREGSGLTETAQTRARRVTAKAWRFAGEMGEISSTFSKAGVPGGFHQAAGEIYARISHFKNAPEQPPLAEVLEALIKK